MLDASRAPTIRTRIENAIVELNEGSRIGAKAELRAALDLLNNAAVDVNLHEGHFVPFRLIPDPQGAP